MAKTVAFQEVKIEIQKGDRIKSKKGLHWKGEISGKDFLVFDLEYRGDGRWLAHKKEEL
jgi:hypothetical protein